MTDIKQTLARDTNRAKEEVLAYLCDRQMTETGGIVLDADGISVDDLMKEFSTRYRPEVVLCAIGNLIEEKPYNIEVCLKGMKKPMNEKETFKTTTIGWIDIYCIH